LIILKYWDGIEMYDTKEKIPPIESSESSFYFTVYSIDVRAQTMEIYLVEYCKNLFYFNPCCPFTHSFKIILKFLKYFPKNLLR